MCRWLAYTGPQIFLQELVADPDHSLIDQSIQAEEGKTVTSGDGFGIGWYNYKPSYYASRMGTTDKKPPSLYWSEHSEGQVVVSEPYDCVPSHWHEVRPNSLLTICPGQKSRVKDLVT